MLVSPRPRILHLGLLALGVAPAALLAAMVVHVGFCRADPHAHGATAEPLCCEMIESPAHGHHHPDADLEHGHPAILERDATGVVPGVAVVTNTPASFVASPDGPNPGPNRRPRDPPSTPLFLASHALLL